MAGGEQGPPPQSRRYRFLLTTRYPLLTGSFLRFRLGFAGIARLALHVVNDLVELGAVGDFDERPRRRGAHDIDRWSVLQADARARSLIGADAFGEFALRIHREGQLNLVLVRELLRIAAQVGGRDRRLVLVDVEAELVAHLFPALALE